MSLNPSYSDNNGKIEIEGITQITWKFHDYFSVTEKDDGFFRSPLFLVASNSWRLRLWHMGSDEEVLHVCLYREGLQHLSSVECEFGVKTLDGSVEYLHWRILKENEPGISLLLIKRSELLERKSELVPSNTLTVVCKLKFGHDFRGPFWDALQPVGDKPCHSTHQTVEKPEAFDKNLIRLDKLSENFKGLLGNEETCDTTLKVKEKVYKAHGAVLIARSPVFAAMFTHDTSERQTGVITIPDCDPDSFRGFLEYLYCGKLEEISFPSVLHLYETSNKYDVPEVKEFCVEYLKHCLTVENTCEIVVFADKYEETDLFTASQDFFNNNVKKNFETSEWESLLKKHYRLGNKLLKEMSKVKIRD